MDYLNFLMKLSCILLESWPPSLGLSSSTLTNASLHAVRKIVCVRIISLPCHLRLFPLPRRLEVCIDLPLAKGLAKYLAEEIDSEFLGPALAYFSPRGPIDPTSPMYQFITPLQSVRHSDSQAAFYPQRPSYVGYALS